VIDLTAESVVDGVRRITAGNGVDIVIESVGGTLTSQALSSLSLGGILITLGYSAGRKTTIDLTDLIWKRARMAGFSLFAQSPTAIAAAWRDIIPLIVSGSIRPIIARRQIDHFRFGRWDYRDGYCSAGHSGFRSRTSIELFLSGSADAPSRTS
jgi:NADPH:quinone reductase-like Zn-dependent oxidoreductase